MTDQRTSDPESDSEPPSAKQVSAEYLDSVKSQPAIVEAAADETPGVSRANKVAFTVGVPSDDDLKEWVKHYSVNSGPALTEQTLS